MKLRVLIADDEALSRERLRNFVLEDPRAEIVAECRSGTETLDSIRETAPELLFLDIMMPEVDGFSVLEQFKGARLPVIIFVTAYDRFAVRAFDVHAVDYLLKPFDRARFQVAFDRALERLKTILAATDNPVQPESTPSSVHRLAIKAQGRISLINTADIDWICSADNYVELHVSKTTHLLRTTLAEIATQLPRDAFLRISRSHLVNFHRVKEIRSKSHGDALVLLQDGTSLPASRTYRHELTRVISRLR